MSCPCGGLVKIQRSSGSEKLQNLRSRIADNSQDLIRLFRERAELAREIGEVKKEIGLPSRIREREESVLEDLGDLDFFSRSVISSLFEFSILNEDKDESVISRTGLEKNKFSISSSKETLELLAGLLISRPGVVVYTERKLSDHLEEGIQVNGGHIVMGDCQEPDLKICIGKDGENCDFVISDSNHMKFSLKFPVKPGEIAVKVIQ